MKPLSKAVRALIEGANYAHLATLLPDGSPHSVPLWVGLEGGRIVFLTSPRSRKAQNVARDPRVALSITDHAQPNTMASIRGRVIDRIEGDVAWAIIDRLSAKYIGQPYPLRSDRAVLVVEADQVFEQSVG